MTPQHPDNNQLAARLEEFADLLEAKGIEYKPSAYRRAAENVRDYPGSVAELAQTDSAALEEIDRVGDAIASKLREYIDTGTIEELEALRQELPVNMDALTAVEGIGPKTVGRLYEELQVQTLTDLERVARAGEIRELHGFGAKTEQNIIDNLEFAKQADQRELLGDARPVADRLLEHLATEPAVEKQEVAGSIRRWRPTIGDIDLLVGSTDPPAVIEAFQELADERIESGTSKASIRTDGVRADLRVVAPDEYGSALQYFTGSKEHNIQLRNYALERGLSLNEYGAFRVDEQTAETTTDPDRRVAGDTEASMYEALDLAWIPPELREGNGEIEAAATGTLPSLLTVDDLRGDLHVHTEWSDGAATIEEMADAAAAVGHDYLAITDHASGPGIVEGIGRSDAELREEMAAIKAVNEEHSIELLAGVETNIDAEGGLSTGEDLLAALDIVVASPHSGLSGDGTDRLLAAIEHPEVDIIGHPSGRLLNQRSGLTLDPAELGAAAADTGTALEVNSDPARLDLWGEVLREAIDAGAPIAINTDAHRPSAFKWRRYGVHTARRGWAEPTDVINAAPIATLR